MRTKDGPVARRWDVVFLGADVMGAKDAGWYVEAMSMDYPGALWRLGELAGPFPRRADAEAAAAAKRAAK